MSADFHLDLERAEAHLGSGRPDQAFQILSECVRRHPDVAELRGRLGVVCCMVGRLDEAADAFEAALALNPAFIDARANLGMTRLHLGERSTGERLIRQALALKPDHAGSWQVAASAAYGQGLPDAALTAARRTLAMSPGESSALALSALLLRRAGRVGEGFRAARLAIVLDPGQAEIVAVAAIALRDIGDSEDAIRMFRRALAVQPTHADTRSAMIMCLNYVSSTTPGEMLAESRLWERWHAPRPRSDTMPEIRRTGALRVGLVSGDFKRHAVGYFLSGALGHLDRRRIEVSCFSTSDAEDAVTGAIRRAATSWHDIRVLADDAAYDLVRHQEIDILVDLSGYTAGSRLTLFALKPAPVQAAWIGYFGTTGLSAIDWLIADRHLVPPGEERWFSEKILRLPDSYVCYRPPDTAPQVSAPPSDDADRVTFGSCNALAKLSPATVVAWSRILRAVPGSRLLLKAGGLEATSVRDRVRGTFTREGVDPDRLILEGWSAYADFLGTYGRIDVALDPFPFCGGLSTVETLWMGVPLVTLTADRFAGRQSTSHLSTIGHSELCAPNMEDYVRLAVGLARNPGQRRHLRSTLRSDMAASPLLDYSRFAGHLAGAFEAMAGRSA